MLPGTTGLPVAALCTAAKHNARLARFRRAPLDGSRRSSMAHRSSPMAPWNPSGNHAPSREGRDRPSAVEKITLWELRFGPALLTLPRVPADEGRVLLPVSRASIEEQRGLRAVVLHHGLRQERSQDCLRRSPRRAGVHYPGGALAHERRDDVEPVYPEVI